MKSPKMAAFVSVQLVVLVVQVMLLRATMLASSGNQSSDSPVRDAAYEVQEQDAKSSQDALIAARQAVVRSALSLQNLSDVPSKLALTDLFIVDGDGLPLIHLGARSGTSNIHMLNRLGEIIARLEYDGQNGITAQFGKPEWPSAHIYSNPFMLVGEKKHEDANVFAVDVVTAQGITSSVRTPLEHKPGFYMQTREFSGGEAGPKGSPYTREYFVGKDEDLELVFTSLGMHWGVIDKKADEWGQDNREKEGETP